MNEERENTQQPTAVKVESAPSELSGIAGWLILPAIGFAIGPPILIGATVWRLWSITPELSVIEADYPGYSNALWGTESLNIVFAAFVIYVAILFFKKRRTARWLAILFFLVNFTLTVVECSWFTSIDEWFFVDTYQPVFSSFISMMIWIPYFIFSKRVKNTFIY